MNDPRPIYYFLTEDIHNAKERNEIEYLTKSGRVVLVSRGADKVNIPNVRHLRLPVQSGYAAKALLIWTKICYLICRIANSASDISFPSRNIYSGGKLVQRLTNLWWRIKLLPVVNKLLPGYDWTYFAPVRLWQALACKRKLRRGARVIIHDSLILRLGKFTSLISLTRRSGVHTVGNVKSWDNPFYTQFAAGADAYLVWSESMWQDVARVHKMARRPIHVWGARPFYNFAHTVERLKVQPLLRSEVLTVGYAAAFCDSVMVKHEVAVLVRIAAEFSRLAPAVKILVRPYPILPVSEYADLVKCANVVMVDIQGPLMDRYNDGREFIRFGSDEERIDYLARCDCFLSMATSFTMEAAIFGLPIVHFFMRPADCTTASEHEFFERITISDHLDVYFNQGLFLSSDYAHLIGRTLQACDPASPAYTTAQLLLRRLGIPSENSTWADTAQKLWSDLKPAVLR
jgi:hypothetical protein